MRALALALLAPLACLAHPHEREIERALIQRDQQSAEFSRPALGDLHRQQLRDLQGPGRPDTRSEMARERDARVLRLPPPEPRAKPSRPAKPLPLPGGPRHGVDPVPAQGVGG